MNKKKKGHLLELLLVISALFLGVLVVILVYRGRTETIITGPGQGTTGERNISGSYPLPSELVPSDITTYFAYTEIPDIIFNRIKGVSFTEDCPVSREELRYMTVLYWGPDGAAHKGELIVNRAIAQDVAEIFYELYKASYPIESVKLIDEYGGSDEVSMAKNNTSCFNARKMTGAESWSLHAYGLAVDINPLYNPYVGADGTILPVSGEQYADRNNSFLMKIDEQDYAYRMFAQHGFTWGGSWSGIKDYQHFEKKAGETE